MKNKYIFILCLAAANLSSVASASMGNLAMSYGLHANDLASAQSMSMFNVGASSTYYNPAYLSKVNGGRVLNGLVYAKPSYTVNTVGGAAPANRVGDEIASRESKNIVLGITADMSGLLAGDKKLTLGLVLGLEEFGQELMAFSSATSQEGQLLRHERTPLFLSVGIGTSLTKGVDLGFSVLSTLESQANLRTYTSLAGDTNFEVLNVSAKPTPQPIISANFNMDDLFCEVSKGDACLFRGYELAIAYRNESQAKTVADANTIIPGTVPSPGLSLRISTIAAYQPSILSLGLLKHKENMKLAFTIERQFWSGLEGVLKNDVIKDQANAGFSDTLIIRAGLEYSIRNIILEQLFFLRESRLIAGISKEDSPLNSGLTPDVNYLDNDSITVGLGLSGKLKMDKIFAKPIIVSLAYQRKIFKDREFSLVHSLSPAGQSPFEIINTGGSVNALTGSIELQF